MYGYTIKFGKMSQSMDKCMRMTLLVVLSTATQCPENSCAMVCSEGYEEDREGCPRCRCRSESKIVLLAIYIIIIVKSLLAHRH